MSLHDVDKDNNHRRLPKPNQNDELIQRKANNTLSTAYATATDNPTSRVVFKRNVILTYDDANRVSSVYGYVPGLANYPVLIIANYGYDVYTDILGLTAPTV